MREPGAHRIGVALAVALGLHAALFVALASRPRAAPSATTATTAGVELAIDVEAPEPEVPASKAPAATPPASEAPAATPFAALERALPEATARTAEPASEPSPESAPAETPAPAPSAGIESAAAAAPAATPALGLAALGIGHALSAEVLGTALEGTGTAPSQLQRAEDTARARRTDSDSTKERSEARLEHSLRTDLAVRDQKRGLGPEAPVVLALERLTYEDATTAPNGEATVRVRVDGNGMLTTAELVAASSDTDAWRRILEMLMKELGREPLPRVPPRGASIEIKLVSREQLPSGASPGLQVDVLGIPVSRGRGPNPTKITLLSPVAIQVPIPGDPDGVTLPFIGLGFGVFGDPVDIGAKARRVVRARVTKYEVQ
jgi:hypothetical protein